MLPFLKFLSGESIEVKTKMVENLGKIFSHMTFKGSKNAAITFLTSCLDLIEDPEYNIRRTFSQMIGQVISGDITECSKSTTDQLIFNRVKEAYSRARADGDAQLQETILLTSGNLGKVSEGDRLLVVVINLLESMLSQAPLVAATAYLLLQELAKSKDMKMQTLFMRFRQPVCQFLANAMHDAQEDSRGKGAQHILQEVTNVLDFPDLKSFIQVSKKYLLPYLVSKATQTASNIIKILATAMGAKNRKLILINNTQYIFSCLVRSCHGAELEKALHFLQKETDFELGSLLRLRFQQVHNELLLYLCANYQQVFQGLRMLASHDKEPREINTSNEMADFLQPRLLGFLAYFDVQLADNHVPIEDKKLALESLISIMRLMGVKHITPVRLKVITTLRRSLELTEEGFPEISCRAWNCFVRSVDYPSLGPLLSQIIAALLSLIQTLPRQIADIFNFLIVENRKVLHGHFHEIYFLPEIPELSDANMVLKQYTEGPSSQSDVRSQITHFLKGVTHENLDIRLHALSKLRLLLQQHQSAIHKLIIGNETADPIISQLVSVLLTGCRESDQRAQLLYAECLGELGAIDPGRLDLAANNPKQDSAHFHASVDDDNFAFDLINDVTRAFLAATEPDVQNCSALALQELLQIYNIGVDKEPGSSGHKLWRRFPEQTQEILLPLLSSRYVLQSNQDWSKLEKPIYMSKKGSKFKDWVTIWTGYLTSKVTEDKARKVFLSCAAQIKQDIHITLYLLPHVVLYVLLDGTEDDRTELYTEILEVISQVKKPETRHGSASDFRHMSAQTVYSIFDYLNKWRQRRAQVIAAKAGNTKGDPAYLSDASYQAVSQFLGGIPLEGLSEASFNCKGYTRALMYFEHYITSTKQDLQEHLDFLQQLYASMGEADGVQGVAALRHSQATLHEEILVHECTGQLTYALACYERAIQLEASNISLHQGLLRNYMDLGQQSTALVQVSGILAERPGWVDELNSYRVEAAWKLGSWSKLETFCTQEKQRTGWSVGLGRVLLAAKHRDEEEFFQQLKSLRGEQMGPLSAASMESGSYQRGYENITRLHMLNELEQGLKSLAGFPSVTPDSTFTATPRPELLRQWEARLSMAQCSFRTQEPILTLRKTLFLLTQDKDDHPMMDLETGRIWLRIAKVARKAGHLQTSYSAMLQASNCNLTLLCQEKAKLLWTKGDHDQALATLEAGIAENFGNASVLKVDQSPEGKTKRSEYARALLLFGNYSEETSSMESNAIMKQYKDVIEANMEWEDGHFYLARYYDKIMTTLIDERDRPEKQGEFTIYVVRYFGQSLRYGSQYIYQSMPRLLSLWLDYGSMVVDAEKKEKGKSSQKLQTQRTILDRLNKIISNLRQQLAPYQLFTTLPQLISRICHAHPGVSAELQEIIAALLVAFPQQAMWMMMAVSKSSYHMRVKRCQEIFAKAKDKNRDLPKFILDATKLTEKLLELCEKEVPKMMSTLSMTQHFRPLRRLLEDSQFSSILMPLQDAMTVTLPSGNESLENHDPFPGQQIYIDGFEDTIEILASLQKPKKITMKGSNGRLYVMMCKPKDDLRKDCRLMEFNGIVNKFLRRDPDSRRRQLHIRTYTVVPLNEECGLIEWVNNTSGLRYILIKLYREKCLYMSGKELQACMPTLHSSIDTKLAIYRTKLLVRHPPVFSEWFLRTFTDPTSWYSARLSYTRTTAVMSMVGYILGLGDRHGENILFDSTNGDCVHVDFNCLFNKGETFEWPERVPFRLTPNMVEAMGPLGYEGLFRQACEVTLRVMRNQMDSLMSVLKPFVYDPLVEWSKPARGRSNPADSGEITNEQAMTHVLNIEHRLKGILKSKTKPRGLPLSIDGHVNYLIKESTDEKNLCQMYIGWAAYL
ncbi:serine/threonine-protein kinase ATR-like [Liolophura sinensis]|uniref:serine/threonine-protein kinase ATR-like n=1 Tax=Liolophura sinensis TaxID=3198878 RepID=UPI003158EF9C